MMAQVNKKSVRSAANNRNFQERSAGEALSGSSPRNSDRIADSAVAASEPVHIRCARKSWCSKCMTKPIQQVTTCMQAPVGSG